MLTRLGTCGSLSGAETSTRMRRLWVIEVRW